MDETGVYYTEWGKSEREHQCTISTHIYGKMIMTILYSNLKRDADVKNRLLDSVREGEDKMIWEKNVETCILPYIK